MMIYELEPGELPTLDGAVNLLAAVARQAAKDARKGNVGALRFLRHLGISDICAIKRRTARPSRRGSARRFKGVKRILVDAMKSNETSIEARVL